MLKFKKIEDRLDVSETIDSLILHLQMIRTDLTIDVGAENSVIASSIDRRMCSVNVLNELLTEYTKQHDASGE